MLSTACTRIEIPKLFYFELLTRVERELPKGRWNFLTKE